MQMSKKQRSRTYVYSFTTALLVLALGALPAQAQDFFNGFEEDTEGWVGAVRVPSGTNGIPSADGDFHATGANPFTRWGGYTSTFPAGGYMTSIDIYLDVDAGFANDTRLDFSSAINTPAGTHRRDFVFNLGFYNDATGPGADSDRFVVSVSNNAGRGNSFPKNPDRDPIAISETGWYTFEHAFRDDGSGILEVELSIYDADGALVHSWVLSNPTDIIGTTVGGNRYGWFASNELGAALAFDNSLKLADTDGDGLSDGEDECPNSDFSDFVDVGSGPTTIDNDGIGVDESGCTIQDRVNECADSAKNHGQYVSCIVHLANDLHKAGVITKSQRQEMKTGAAKSNAAL